MSDSNEVITDPRLEKRTRGRFSVAEKKRLLAEADNLPYGEKGGWLRRKGLYAGQLSTWRKDLAKHGESGVAARQPGRKPADPRDNQYAWKLVGVLIFPPPERLLRRTDRRL